MKKKENVVSVVLLLVLLVMPINVLAHPGRTDSNGCHTCRTNCAKWGLNQGEYHCHNSGDSRTTRISTTTAAITTTTTTMTTTARTTTAEIVPITKNGDEEITDDGSFVEGLFATGAIGYGAYVLSKKRKK